MANNQITPFQLTDQFTMDNFNQRINETNTALQNKADSNHTHSASDITSGTLGVARGGTGKSSVTSGNFLVGNGTGALTEKTPAQVLSAIGAAPVKSPSFTGTPKAPNGTDYTTARIRNIQASTTDLTAGSSSLANGVIYLVYE